MNHEEDMLRPLCALARLNEELHPRAQVERDTWTVIEQSGMLQSSI